MHWILLIGRVIFKNAWNIQQINQEYLCIRIKFEFKNRQHVLKRVARVSDLKKSSNILPRYKRL